MKLKNHLKTFKEKLLLKPKHFFHLRKEILYIFVGQQYALICVIDSEGKNLETKGKLKKCQIPQTLSKLWLTPPPREIAQPKPSPAQPCPNLGAKVCSNMQPCFLQLLKLKSNTVALGPYFQ